MGPGRTGVKGVIRDRNEVLETEKAKKAGEMKELNKKMAKLGEFAGKSTAEEEWEKKRAADLENKGAGRGVPASRGGAAAGRFGHLREVGEDGFVNAVEERDVFVVVHLPPLIDVTDQSLDRCADLDDTLARLARSNPNTKFIRTRASAIGFASTGPRKQGKHKPGKTYIISEGVKFDEEEEEEEEDEEDDVDLDMLPTLLVYRGGEVVQTWVRVDWEAGKEGVESLLLKHNILGKRTHVNLDDYPEEDLSD